jgi:hypothetical protein
MSDLRTELFTKVLPKMHSLTKPTSLDNLTFDDPEQPEVPATPDKLTNNELIFGWVKQHPAAYAKDICAALAKDINYDSVQSQIHSLATRGILHKAKCSSTGKFMYSAAVDAYPRSARMEAIAKMNEARAKIGKEEMARRISEGHKANRAVEAETKLEPTKKIVLVKRREPEPETTPAVQVTPVDLNTLSIVQARKLYDELKQIFGA